MNSDKSLGEIIGDNVKRIRHERHITQEKLSEKSGVAVNTIRNMEKGRWPSAHTLTAVSKALNIDAKFLLSYDSDKMYLKEELQSKLNQAIEFILDKPASNLYSLNHVSDRNKK